MQVELESLHNDYPFCDSPCRRTTLYRVAIVTPLASAPPESYTISDLTPTIVPYTAFARAGGGLM